MTLSVQNDQGNVITANSYVDVATFKSYHADRGNSYDSPSDDLIGQALIKATDYLDARFPYVGMKITGATQTTEWPRFRAYDQDDRIINGIHQAVKEATCEYAWRALTATLNPDPMLSPTGLRIQSQSQTFDVMSKSTTYATELPFDMPEYPAADAKLRRAGLIRSRNSGNLKRG
jgi:hypothetical protein